MSPQLQFLARRVPGPLGQAVGTITAHPEELDDIVAAEYCPIYDGNVDDQHAHAEEFVNKYNEVIFKGPTFSLPPIEGRELMATCQKGPHTAGGLDGWAPHDLTLLPLSCFMWWAHLLNAIEGGKQWPQGVLHGKNSFLQKDVFVPSLDPGVFLLLFLLPTLI